MKSVDSCTKSYARPLESVEGKRVELVHPYPSTQPPVMSQTQQLQITVVDLKCSGGGASCDASQDDGKTLKATCDCMVTPRAT